MSNIQLYSNEDFSVRTTQDEDGTVWFVAGDIAQGLEYSEASNPARLFASVPDCWKGVKRIHITSDKPTARPYQDMLCLTEQGVYFFLGRSDKPKALPYQMWIAGDVVPDIMHKGSYLVNQSAIAIPQGVINEAKSLLDIAKITGNQQVLALDKLFKSYTGRSMLQLGEIVLEAPDKKQFLTPTDIGKEFGISARKVNDLLAGAGYQYKIADKWEPLEPGEPYAVMQDVGKTHSDGTPVRQLKWETSILEVIEQLMEAS